AVVGDGGVLPAPSLLAGWSWDDAAYAYSAPPSGLTVNEGVVDLRVVATADGVSASLEPMTSLVRVSVERGAGPRSTLQLLPGWAPGDVVARWLGPPDALASHEWVAVPDPPRFAAEQLSCVLAEAGIRVEGAPRSARRDEVPLATPTVLAREESMTLRELCALTNKDSLNLHAETLLMQLGRLAGAEPTTFGGLQVVGELLVEAGRDPSRVRLVDGSGLSRMNLLSPEAAVSVLRHTLQRDPAFADLLAVAGEPGTLQHRLVGTVGQGRVRAKTGTLTGHRNMVGVVDTLRGRRLVFAIFISGLVLPRVEADAAVDAALLTLVGW
ncbi:MAG: D-alanyl-D-alanine carboxypeptidase/D-alanyl-D-alanine-endopeptidase, partial [Myxococcota bacterium]